MAELIILVIISQHYFLIMGFAPRQVVGMVRGLSGLGHNLGFALGPAHATIIWTVSGSGLLGIRAGLLLLLAFSGGQRVRGPGATVFLYMWCRQRYRSGVAVKS